MPPLLMRVMHVRVQAAPVEAGKAEQTLQLATTVHTWL
jgi:hypothetical protein